MHYIILFNNTRRRVEKNRGGFCPAMEHKSRYKKKLMKF